MCALLSFVPGCKWWSKNSETFLVSFLLLEIARCPSNLLNSLWIFDEKYEFSMNIVYTNK